MDGTNRYITKIAREAARFTLMNTRAVGVGTGEMDFIHLVRHHPGITQSGVRHELKIDKGAAARRAASLEAKGYLVRRKNPSDKRSMLLFATEKAEALRNSKAECEELFYEWLLNELPDRDAEEFVRILSALYSRSKLQRRAGFPDIHVKE